MKSISNLSGSVENYYIKNNLLQNKESVQLKSVEPEPIIQKQTIDPNVEYLRKAHGFYYKQLDDIHKQGTHEANKHIIHEIGEKYGWPSIYNGGQTSVFDDMINQLKIWKSQLGYDDLPEITSYNPFSLEQSIVYKPSEVVNYTTYTQPKVVQDTIKVVNYESTVLQYQKLQQPLPSKPIIQKQTIDPKVEYQRKAHGPDYYRLGQIHKYGTYEANKHVTQDIGSRYGWKSIYYPGQYSRYDDIVNQLSIWKSQLGYDYDSLEACNYK